MHLLSAKPGGFTESAADIVRIEQDPAAVVILSAADTTLALLAAAARRLPQDFPAIRLCNIMHLRHPASIDLYVDDVLQHARVVIVDHLGGESYWPYGTEQLVALAQRCKQTLVMFSGDRAEDPNLARQSTATGQQCQQLWRYLRENGPENALEFFRFVGHAFLGLRAVPKPPRPFPAAVIYSRESPVGAIDDWQARWQAGAPVVVLVFYRSHLAAGNVVAFDELIGALERIGLNPLPLAVNSLKDPLCLETLRTLCAQHSVALILNTTAFATAALDDPSPEPLVGDIPVMQVLLSGGNREDWQASEHGLSPRDLAMQIALPEVDGRIVTRPMSFKGRDYRCERTQFDVAQYQADTERIKFIAELSRRWCRLRSRAQADKRVALIMANYPSSEARMGNGVGLDTPASVVGILHELRRHGYDVPHVPADGDALMTQLMEGVTNDPDSWSTRWARQSLSLEQYELFFATLPADNRRAIQARWGAPEHDPMLRHDRFMVTGFRLGNVFVGLQPTRGYGIDPRGTYHSPDLVPPHHYLAFYFWLRHCFECDAIVHVGKHGNLEWLPGKSVALSESCWPDVIFGPMPHLYPFIVNDPGEGSQAKRRAQAVIVDHLMPPLTRAENYGPLQDLERLVDEYYEALAVGPRRAEVLRKAILDEVLARNLHSDLGLEAPRDANDEQVLLTKTDAYLCELKEAQIRDGLHVFGQSPIGVQKRDTLLALARFPSGDGQNGNTGLLTALAKDLKLEDFDPLDADWTAPWSGSRPAMLLDVSGETWRHAGDTRERLELLALKLLEAPHDQFEDLPRTASVMTRIRSQLTPALDSCGARELGGLCAGLSGRFVQAGPSGAPSRGRPDVLPTGRNFYSVDTRAVPTPTAWQLGFKSAARVIERYLQEHGDYPRSLGLSVWGTATMRTGGDDIAQALALLGVRPVWSAGSHRVADFEILPVSILDRPRVDVTLRVSGFFRDAFTNLIQLFDAAVQAVAELDESPTDNPIRARVQSDAQKLQAQGLDADAARAQAGWRVFGSKPGAYGAGLQALFETGIWESRADLAAAYCEWGGYAYGRDTAGVAAHARFAEQLSSLQLVLQNQDNREHDVLDSDDYYQFQGGMTAAVEHLSGNEPAIYHADHSNPAVPRVRSLQEEVARVVRSRVVNPKWIAGVKRHGYKGAFEMAATVDYLFAFDATTHVVSDYQYEMVTNAFVNDPQTREFLERHNPEALRDICERLMEAIRRELWEAAGPFEQQLEQHLLQAEAQIEART